MKTWIEEVPGSPKDWSFCSPGGKTLECKAMEKDF